MLHPHMRYKRAHNLGVIMPITTAVMVAAAAAVLVLGLADRGSDNPKFKSDKHAEWNDPSKADNCASFY